MGQIRCVLGDRSVFFTEGLRAILRQSPAATIIGTTQCPEDMPALVARTRGAVALGRGGGGRGTGVIGGWEHEDAEIATRPRWVFSLAS